eukprot:m.24925 g.24925  ORF g.24925 m.24925 type:complete len:343 (+) comp7657_c0_seq1:154-1182(+)
MALVADMGSGNMRIGLCGDALPAHVFSTTIEDNAIPPIVRGNNINWDSVEKTWELAYSKLGVESPVYPTLLADCPTIRERDRAAMAEMMFEKFGIPAYFVSSQSVLSLFSAGRTSGLVMDLGYGVSHVMAIHEGFAFPHTIGRIELGGNDINRSFRMLLSERSIDISESMTEEWKLQHGKLAYDFAQESMRCRLDPTKAPSMKLPDGREVSLQSDHLRACESLMQPALAGCRGMGLADALWDAIEICDNDNGPLQSLSQFVLGVGGSSLISGLEMRLKREIDSRAGRSRDIYITCLQAPERHHAAYIGGSLLAGLPQFIDNNFVHKAEYTEEGERAIHKRCC